MKGDFRETVWEIPAGKKVYFASDFHFGIPDATTSLDREKRVVAWLNQIVNDAYAIFLQGDLFDAWIEYRLVVPKGYVRFLGKLAELCDRGIKIVVFTGNHDLWMSGYFQAEIGAEVHHDLQVYVMNGQRFLLGHGDGVSECERGYKLMKSVFRHPLSQWIYKALHPFVGLGLANYFSRRGLKHREAEEALKPDEQEYQWHCVEKFQKTSPFDYIIFGHRHIAQFRPMPVKGHFVNLGDWFKNDTYAVFDGVALRLLNY